MRLCPLCFVVVLAAACSRGDDAARPTDVGAPATAAQPVTPPTTEEPAYILATTGLFKAAAEKSSEGGKEVSNWRSTLQRGDQVLALKQEGEFVQVKYGREDGYVKSSALLLAEGISVATNVEEVKTFTGPKFDKLNPKKTLLPGIVLFVTTTQDAFSEVNYAGAQKTWVQSDKLFTDANEIEAARLVSKARALDDKKDAAAQQFWDLAKSEFGSTRLVQTITAAAEPTQPAPTEGATPQPPAENAQAQ